MRRALPALLALAAPAAMGQTPTVGVTPPTVAGTGADRYMFEREAAGPGGAWTLTASAAPAADLIVAVTVAESGGDFVPPGYEGAKQVTIPAGATEASFNPVRDDRWDEPHGTLTLTVGAGTGYAPSATAGTAAIAVRDDDFRSPPLTFALAPAAGAVIEGVPFAVAQQVRTVADGTFTAPGDLARALPGFAAVRLAWGAVTHLRTEAADLSVTASTHALAASEFATVDDGADPPAVVGLLGTRSLGDVVAAADGTAEGAERAVVALQRAAGAATLIRAAAHPGADGFEGVALSDAAFFRTALTVRDQPLMLDLETSGIDEGQSVALRATMMPPRTQAFTVAVSVDTPARAELAGTNATLSFAAGAMESTGEVRVRAKRTAEGDGRADVTVTGTPSSASGVAAATAALVISERGGSSGAVLWETELTMGAYSVAGEAAAQYGYADTAQAAGLTAVTAGSLDDATFSFQGVEYTVHRLTLTGGNDVVAAQAGEFVARSANGVRLPFGRFGASDHFGSTEGDITSVHLGLEVEGKDGVTKLRRLQPDPGIAPVALPMRWDQLAAGTDQVTVRLIDMGPMAWWNGALLPAAIGDPPVPSTWDNVYFNAAGSESQELGPEVVSGYLVPDTFELQAADGERVRYTVDLLAVSGTSSMLHFSTTPDLPAGVASLLASRRDYENADFNPATVPASDGGTPGDPSDDTPAVPPPPEIYHVFPLTAAAASAGAHADYTWPLGSAALATEALTEALERALLVPMAGAADVRPPPALEEVWRADVTVGRAVVPEDPERERNSRRFVSHGVASGLEQIKSPLGGISDWHVPLFNRGTVMMELLLNEYPDGRVDLTFIPNDLRIDRPTRYQGYVDYGLEIQGDYGARVHWLEHGCCYAAELHRTPIQNVDAGHGWNAGDVRRVRLVRPRHGPRQTWVLDALGTVSADRMEVAVAARVGWRGGLPLGVDTALNVTANGVTEAVTVPAGALHTNVEMTVPLPSQHAFLEVTAAAKDLPLKSRALFGVNPYSGRSGRIQQSAGYLRLVWPPVDASHVEYWSASWRAEYVGKQFNDARFFGFTDRTLTGEATGGLAPARFACCGAPPDSVAGRTVWALGDPDGSKELFDAPFVLGLNGLGDALPDDLKGATLHLEQVSHAQRGGGYAWPPLLTVPLPLDDATVGSVTLNGRTLSYLEWGQLELDGNHMGDYRVRLTGPDRAVLVDVDLVSVPAEGDTYQRGEKVAIRLTFDEPVAVAGVPTLGFTLGSAAKTAAYAHGSGTAELVFEYEVAMGDTDSDGIDVAAFPAALTFGTDVSIKSVAQDADAVYGTHDPAAWPQAKVDGSAAATPPPVFLGDAVADEADGAARLSVLLASAATSRQAFRWRTADGGAVAGKDYVPSSGEVAVEVNDRRAEFEVPLIDDAEKEPEESFVVYLATDDHPLIARAQVTVRDDDDPLVALAGPALAAGGGHVFEHEAGAGAQWTLSRPAAATSGPLTVNLHVSEEGGDFVEAPDEGRRSVAFAAGEATAAFSPLSNDAVRERNGTVTVALLPGAGYALGALDGLTASASVRDDDGAMVSLRMDPAALSVAEGDDARAFLVAEVLADRSSGLYGNLTEPGDVVRVLEPHYSVDHLPVRVSTAAGFVEPALSRATSLDYAKNHYDLDPPMRLDAFRRLPDGRLAQTGRVPPISTTADSVDDDGEMFGAHPVQSGDDSPFGAGGRVVLGEPARTVVTIRDGATLTLAFPGAADGAIAEGDDAAGAGRTTVTATVAPAQPAPFAVAVSARSADDARWEFVGANRTLSFAANATASAGTVTVRAVPNAIDDGNHGIAVAGAPSASAVAPASAQLTITDDDDPVVSILAPALARETGHLFESEAVPTDGVVRLDRVWSLRREGLVGESLDVAVSVAEAGAGDFVATATEASDQTATFQAGMATTSYTPMTMSFTRDDTDEGHGTVTVAVAAGDGYEADPDASSASAAVRDDDGTLLTVGLAPAALTVAEGSAAQLRVTGRTVADGTFTAPGDLPRVFGLHRMPVVVSYPAGAGGDSATAGDDYVGGRQTVDVDFARFAPFAGGGFAGQFALRPIAVLGDTEDDAGEFFTVDFAGTAPARTARAPAEATVTIVEGPTLSLGVSPGELLEGEDPAQQATVAVTVVPVHAARFTATVTATPAADARWEWVRDGAAVAGNSVALDFEADSATPTGGALSIRAVDNDVDEAPLEVALSAVADVDAVSAASAAALTIVDDDLPTVSIAGPSPVGGFLYEGERDDHRWTITRDGDLAVPLEVEVFVSGASRFVATGGETLTFAASSTTLTYDPGIVDDDVDERHGTVSVEIDDHDVETLYRYAPGRASVEVRDDDGTVLEVTVDSPTVHEGDDAVFTVTAENDDGTLTAAAHLDRLLDIASVPVLVATADGTGTNAATAPADYAAIAAGTTVSLDTFAATGGGAKWTGEARTATVDDAVDDPDETFTLAASLPSGTDSRIALGTPATGTATIVEGPRLAIDLSPEEIDEGGTAAVAVTADPAHTAQFTATVTGASDDDARWEWLRGGTALTGNAVTLTFGANSAAPAGGALSIRAVDNDADEAPLEVTLNATASDAAVSAAPAKTLTINDDDLPTVSIAGPADAAGDFLYEAEAAEDDPGRKWTLTRAGLADAALEVTVAVSESGGDFVAAAAEGTQTVTFEVAKATVSYTPVADNDVDGAHGTVTVALVDGDGYDLHATDRSATASVRDDDGVVLTVVLGPEADIEVREGEAAAYTATAGNGDGTITEAGHLQRLFGDATTAVTVLAATADGTAEAPDDYAAIEAGTEFALDAFEATPGGGRWTGEVGTTTVKEDTGTDAGETFTVTLSLPAGTDMRIELGAPAAGTVTLIEGPGDGDLRLCTTTTTTTTEMQDGKEVETVEKTHSCKEKGDGGLAAGRVEVAHDLGWGTVCDDKWSNFDAHVACRELGHAAGQRAFGGSHFGGASDGFPTHLDDVGCLGTEARLKDCSSSKGLGPENHNCNRRDNRHGEAVHDEDAGVQCLAEVSTTRAAVLLGTAAETETDPMTMTVVETGARTLTLAPGGSARYWVALTRPSGLFPDEAAGCTAPPSDPDACRLARDVWVGPRLASSTDAVELAVPPDPTGAGRLWFLRDEVGWSFALPVDVSVAGDASAGTHTVTHESGFWGVEEAVSAADGGYAVPDLKVEVSASGTSEAPSPRSLAVSGALAEVRFDAPLDVSFAPSAADFAALAGGRALAVTGAWTAGASLFLELAGPAPAGGAVRVAYAPSPSSPLAGRGGELVAPFGTRAVALAGPDSPGVPGPKLEGAPGLEAVLLDALRRAPGASPATLSARRRAVSDLSGIGAWRGLRRADLSGNRVADAGPLAALRDLERLDLSGNAVEDLWPLSALAELRVLDLSDNRVSDLSALAGLPRLEVLELSGNAVADVSPLGSLSALRYLGLSGNRVSDVSALADLYALERLDLSGNAVADASPLGDVGRLAWLRLPGNRLVAVDDLGRLVRLRWLWLADNPLSPDAAAAVPWPEGAWIDLLAP